MSVCILRSDGGSRVHQRVNTRYTATHIGRFIAVGVTPGIRDNDGAAVR
jgi:hypothetical protein